MTVLPPLTISPTTHRFFEQLTTAQAATAAYIIGHGAQAGANLGAFQPGSNIHQVCYTQPFEIEFEPAQVLGPIAKHGWPSTIRISFMPVGSHPGSSPHPASTPTPNGLQRLMGSLYEHAFLSYYENTADAMKTKCGVVRNWPNTLTFGRIVRNAFAHGGTINILDNATATWNGITLSAVNNGERVLYNHLSSGDLTLLMIDIDQLF
jgi:hypothetical protein